MTDHSKAAMPALAYSVATFAEANEISEAKVFSEIRDGELETCLVGDRRLITPEQAKRWLARKAERARQVREQRRRKSA